MSDPSPPTSDRLVHVFSVLFIVVGLFLYETVSSDLFPPAPPGSISWPKILGAMAVGAVCGSLGYLVGRFFRPR